MSGFPTRIIGEGASAITVCDVASVFAGGRYARLPFSVKVLAENILRREPDPTRRDRALAALAGLSRDVDLPFRPERVVLQDLLGTPVLVDLAGLRDAVAERGGDPRRVNPVTPTHLVVDHSLNVDHWASPDAQSRNEAIERERNRERFAFLAWADSAFDNLGIIGSGSGILHQINLERLTPVVGLSSDGIACPDTLVGSDSHTTMINAIGVLGWGVGGIEAEAAMLGKPLVMRLPEIVGVRLDNRPGEGVLATDIALALTQWLRTQGVVGAIVEFHGPGLHHLPLPDRATVSNMAPEYGATAAMFPIDAAAINYLRLSGRPSEIVARVEAYARAQGLWVDHLAAAERHRELIFDLASARRSIAGPNQPHERIVIGGAATPPAVAAVVGTLPAKPVVIAAITSCTNTSNPRTMLTAGLLARNARRRGLTTPAWVRTSLAPGSRVVGEYLRAVGLMAPLAELGYAVIGYGCTTCNGMSGPPLDPMIADAIRTEGVTSVAVTSGNRNFSGRVHPQAREVFIMSPPLVVAYGLAGTAQIDLETEPLGRDTEGRPVMLRDLWPSDANVAELERRHVAAAAFAAGYSQIATELRAPAGGRTVPARFAWEAGSTYIQRPPYWSMARADELTGLRPLVIVGDHVTTDHISPSGAMLEDSDTARYLTAHGVQPADFNSYGTRRGAHEAAMRATFASPRLKNEMLPDGREGPYTLIQPEGEAATIFDASQVYAGREQPLIAIAGKNYGSGSSRDWAAKGPRLLGVRVVLAESFERIHRQNLAGLGILPLQFKGEDSRLTLGLTGTDLFDLLGVEALRPGGPVTVRVRRADGSHLDIETVSRLDTDEDVAFFRHGGLLPQLLTEFVGDARTMEPA